MSEKGRLSPRANGLQRSPSDAGRSSGDEAKKQAHPGGRAPGPALSHTVSDPQAQSHGHTSRTPTSTFGFKKQPASGLVTMVTASGATITSGSATLGKMPKSAGRSLAGGLKAGGPDGGGHAHHDDGFLPLSARSTLQYRSLPRPSRSGAAARSGNRSSTSSIEAAVLSVTTHGKSVVGVAKTNGTANQTDREKGVADPDNLRGGGATTVPLSGRQQVSSPTLRR